MNFLIDENLSPRLVHLLGEKGFPAQHVAHTGMAGTTDPEVWKYAFDHEQIVVQWLEPVVDWLLASSESLINKVIEVNGVDRFKVRTLPPP